MGFGTSDLGMGVTFTFVNRASMPAQAAGRDVSRMSRVVTASVATINTAVSTLTTTLVGLTFVVGGLLGPYVAMTKASADFNQQMSEVAAKARIEKTSADYAALEAQTLALGEATKFTAIEVAAGQTFLAQTGLEVNRILEAMPGMLSLAAAGNMDLARTADIASNILIAMGLHASEMSRVADVLAAASTRANVNVEQLGESFKFAAPYAQQMGASVEQVAAIVGMLGDMGVQGTLAGTAFKNFVAQSAKLNPDKLAKFGLTMADITDQAGNFLGIDVMFANIMKQIKGLGSQQRIAAMTELFGLRGNVALASQMSRAAKDLKVFTLQLENSAGEANAIANKMLDNLNGDIIKFRSVIQTSLIVAGKELEAFMRPIVQRLTDWVRSFKEFVQTPFGRWVIRITAALAGLTAMIALFGFVTTIALPAIWSMVTAFSTLMIEMAPFILMFALIGAGIVMAVKGVNEFNKAVAEGKAATSGFIRFLQQLGGIVSGAIQIWRSWNGETFELSESMYQMMQQLGIDEFVLNLGTWIVRIKEFWNGFQATMQIAWVNVRSVVNSMVESIRMLINEVKTMFPSLMEGQGSLETWKKLGIGFANTVYTNFILPIMMLGTVVDLLAQGIQFLIRSVKDIITLGGEFINGGITGAIRAAIKMFEEGDGGPVARGLGAGASYVNEKLTMADTFIDKQVEMLANLIAEKMGLKSNMEPAVIDKTNTILESLNIEVTMDGETFGTRRLERDELEDNRN